MDFRTIVDIAKPGFELQPCEKMLFVGSCFADEIGSRFRENGFPVTVNPYGTMYNPVSILHTIEKLCSLIPSGVRTVFLTLGTNHVYRLKETGDIVDNCEKRPASLFKEEKLSIQECVTALQQAITLLHQHNPDIHVVLTVSPIRYRKYGYHESQLSKATLLMAVDQLINCQLSIVNCQLYYFPAYEILMDELRDYRFYASDMLHPSQQAVDYIWERLVDWCFSPKAKQFLDEWRPLKLALAHKPFNPDSEEYRRFQQQTRERLKALQEKYPNIPTYHH